MTDDNTTDAVEQTGESTSGEDTPLVKDLRKQLKAAQSELKAVPSRSEIEAEIRAAVAREKAIESQLIALKLPVGLSETVDGKLGGAEVTPEKVAEALKAIGFELTDSSDGEAQQKPEQAAADLAEVANLSNQVANAAKQQSSDSITDKINSANSAEEVAKIMREAGLGN